MVAIASIVVVLHHAGSSALATPSTVDLDAWGRWVETTGPTTVAVALVRLGSLVVAYHLLGSLALAAAGRAFHRPGLIRCADRFTLPGLRGPVRRMLGLGLTATAALATPLPRTVAASPPGPIATMHVADPAPLGTATLRATAPLPGSGPGAASLAVVEPRADDPAAVHAATAADRAGPDGFDPARSDDPGAVIDHAGPTHRVVPGDHLWSIAERTVEARTGRADEATVERYWRTLVAANPQLAHPDLVFPGEVLALPPLDATG